MVESCDEGMGWAGGWAVGSGREDGVIVVSGFCVGVQGCATVVNDFS